MYIIFDIGGTKTRVAGSRDLVTFGDPIKFETPSNFDEGIARIVKAAKEITGGEKIAAVGGGIRGPLNRERTELLSETILTDWVGKPIVGALTEALDAPVYLENDAAVAALGEAHYGAGKGYEIVAYHTVSTGVGGARVVKGVLDATVAGFEPGKQIIDADNTLCPTCRGNFEDMISGTALERRFKKKPYEIPQGDPVWGQLARWLAYGLRNTVMYWSPDVIVLGGSMIVGDPRILLSDIVAHTKEIVGSSVPIPAIKDAALGDSGGLFGSMGLIKTNMGLSST